MVDATLGHCQDLLEFLSCVCFFLFPSHNTISHVSLRCRGNLMWTLYGIRLYHSHIHMLTLVISQVHGAGCHRLPRRNPSIRLHFHRNVSLLRGLYVTRWYLQQVTCFLSLVLQVLHLHIFLGLQNLLCVRLHDAGPGHLVYRDCVCHHRVYVLPAQRWGLQMVSVALFCHSLTLTSESSVVENNLFPCFRIFWSFITCLLCQLVLFSAFLLFFRQWTSFLSAASTAVYVYMYSFYYYFFKTK